MIGQGVAAAGDGSRLPASARVPRRRLTAAARSNLRLLRTSITARLGATIPAARQPHRTKAATCAPHVGPPATVRDGSRSAATAGRSRHGEHPGARVSIAETLMGGACQQPQFAESDVRHARRMTRSMSLPSPRRSTRALLRREGRPSPARTVATGHVRSTGLPSRTKSTEPEDRARRSEVSVHHDSRRYPAFSASCPSAISRHGHPL